MPNKRKIKRIKTAQNKRFYFWAIVALIPIGLFIFKRVTGAKAETLSLTDSTNYVQIDVPKRYRALINKGDNIDYIQIYDRQENNSSPDNTFEISGPYIRDNDTEYHLKYDDTRVTRILESTDSRVKVRVEGCFDTAAGSACLKDDGSDDVIWVTETYTFTTEGVFVEQKTNFEDGLTLESDQIDDGYNWIVIDADKTDAAYDDKIYFGDGSTEGNAAVDYTFNHENDYAVFPGKGNYQSAIVGISNLGWIETGRGVKLWNLDVGNSGAVDRLMIHETDTVPEDTVSAEWFFLLKPQSVLNSEDKRETLIGELRNPDSLSYTSGSNWTEKPNSTWNHKGRAQILNYIDIDTDGEVSYEGGSTYSRATTEPNVYLGNNTYPRRGFLEFDISDIPDDATIDRVQIIFYIGDTYGTGDTVDIKQVDARASTFSDDNSGNQGLWNAINDETTTYKTSTDFASGSYRGIDLGTDAVTNMQNQLGDDWFGIYLQGSDESTDYTSFSATEYTVLDTRRPNLAVVYNSFDSTSFEQELNEPHQRKSFYDSTYDNYWLFYDNGSNLEYAYAPADADGEDWTSLGTTICGGSISTAGEGGFSVWFEDNYVYLAYRDSESDIQTCRGAVGDGTVTWDAASNEIINEATSLYLPYITKDSQGNCWVSATYYDGSDYQIVVSESADTNCDENSSWGAITKVNDTDDTSYLSEGAIMPLADGNVYAIWKRHAAANIEGKLYDGDWDQSQDTISSDASGFQAAVDENYYIHTTLIESTYPEYVKYIQRTDSWGTEIAIETEQVNQSSISIDTNEKKLYLFWEDGIGPQLTFQHQAKYRTCNYGTDDCSSTDNWDDERLIAEESTGYPAAGAAPSYSGASNIIIGEHLGSPVSTGTEYHWLGATSWRQENDGFSEHDGTYTLKAASNGTAVFDIDGGTYKQQRPAFKIGGYKSSEEPAYIALEGNRLKDGTDYHLEQKPFTNAVFADSLTWYSTMENAAAVINPDVGNTGATTNISASEFVSGRYGKGVEVNESGEFASLPMADNVNPNVGTIELWYKETSGASSYGRFFGSEEGTNDDQFTLYRNNSDTALRFRNGSLCTWDPTTINVFDGKWHHIRVTYDFTADSYHLYLDGIDQGERTDSISPPSTAYDLTIGNSGYWRASPIGGIVDEFKIYDTVLGPDDFAEYGDTSEADEYLYDEDDDYTMSFNAVDSYNRGEYAYFGADAPFYGMNVDLETLGDGTSPTLAWEYWDGDEWADLESVSGFTDETSDLTADGAIYWGTRPTTWDEYSVNGSADLYYVRTHLASGNYTTQAPVENTIKTDILNLQLFKTITTDNQTIEVLPEQDTPLPPIAHWKFEEGYGTTAQDSSENNHDGTLGTGGSAPSWTAEDRCVSGKCLQFDGSGDYAYVGDSISNVKTVEFWVKPATTTEYFVDLNGSAYVTASSGTISATGFSSPTIYVDGQESTTVEANKWQHLTVTTNTEITASAINIGSANDGFLQGFVDEVKLYSYARTAQQIKEDYAGTGSVQGISAGFGGDDESWLSEGLVGYWPLDEEASGTNPVTRLDYSGNGNDLTDSNPYAPSTTGKFSRAASFEAANGENLLITDSNQNGLDLSTNFSIGAWTKITSATGWQTIFARRYNSGGGNYQGYELQTTSDSTRLVLNISSTCTSSTALYTNSGFFDLNEWTQVYVTYDGAAIRMYKNGAEYTGGSFPYSWSESLCNTVVPFCIGARASSASACGTNPHDGIIDEVRVYNRALSPSEVEKLYNWAPGPKLYYKFDEGTGTGSSAVHDSSSNGYHANMAANVTETDWRTGKHGKALYFNDEGSSDYVFYDDSSEEVFPTTTSQNFTIESWIKLTGNPASSYWYTSYPIGKTANVHGCSAAALGFYAQWYNANSRRLRFNVPHDSSDPVCANATSINGPYINLDTWYHLTGTYAGDTGEMNFYVDGTRVGTTTWKGAAGEWNWFYDTLTFGYNYIGLIDEFKIYDYVRTPTQIVEDMNAGHPVGGSPIPSQSGYWKFDEGYGTTAYDSSENSNNGTLAGATGPTWTLNGKYDKALDFDGADDYVSIAADSSLDLNSKPSYTVCNWIYPHSDGEGSTGEFWSKGNNYMRVDTESGNTMEVSAYLDLLGGDASYNSTQTINKNSWSHICMVWQDDSDDEFDLYINGILGGTSSGGSGGPANDSSATLYIGGDSSNNFDGLIDEVKIYNAALTADQIKKEFNQGKAQVLGKGDKDNLWDGLVGYWPLDESASGTDPATRFDYSGNNNHLTDHSPYTVSASGKFSRGGDFENSDGDYLYITDANQNNLDITGDITLAAWVKTESNPENMAIISKYETASGTGRAYTLFFDSGGDRIYARLSPDGTLENSVAAYPAENTRCAHGIWCHYALVYNGTDIRLYMNGELAENGTNNPKAYTQGIADTSAEFQIGNYESTSTPYFDGVIDEARVYNRALSPTEILQLYNWTPGPAGYWKLDENVSGDSKTIYDSSGNGNHGTTSDGANNTGMSCTIPGKYGAGCAFDDTDDYILVTDNDTFMVDDTENFSVMFWTYLNAQENTAFLSKRTVYETMDWLVSYNQFQGVVFTVGESGASNIFFTISPNSRISNDTWHHIAITKTGYTYDLYIDGIYIQTDTSTQTWVDSDNFVFGACYPAGGCTLNGGLDEIRIYNYARTQKQILEDMNAGKPADIKPLGWWRFDECSGTTAYDVSGNSNNGTISIGASTPNTSAGTCTSESSSEAWYNGVSGKLSYSLDFDGVDDTVTYSAGGNLDLNSKPAVSLCAWVYPNSDGEGDTGEIWSKGNSYLRVDTESGSTVEISALLDLASADASRNTTQTIPIDSWSHICVTWEDDTDDELTIYVNGKREGASSNGSGSFVDDTSDIMYIGGDSSNNFDGQIDDFRIYNYEITPDQVKNLYTGGAIRFE